MGEFDAYVISRVKDLWAMYGISETTAFQVVVEMQEYMSQY